MFTIAEIQAVTGGKVTGRPLPSKIIGISTDTRTLKPGELFIPLKGPRFDGQKFIKAALKSGAAVLKVKDGLKALQRLAAYHRNKFDVPIIGVTGSSGKTTTKDMLASILAQEMKVLKNKENLNNEIGVPLTLLKLNKSHQAAVLEMAMQGLGEIDELAKIARPNLAIITNVGEAHLLHLKSQKNIARAKAEVLKFCKYAVLPADDKFFKFLKRQAPKSCQIIPFGIIQMGHNLKYLKNLPLPGRHNVYNALAAIKVAKLLKLKPASIARGLKKFKPSSQRMEFIRLKDNLTIINDTYNANPSSMKAALQVLASQPAERRIAVLGDMLELGGRSKFYHEQVLNFAYKLGIDLIFTKGKEFSKVSHLPSPISHLQKTIKPGDVVLVKGSRGMRMEEVVDALQF